HRVALREFCEVVEKQIRDRAVRAPGILRIVALTARVVWIGGPVVAFMPGEPQRPFSGLTEVALLHQEISVRSEHPPGLAQEAIRERQVVDHVVRDQHIDARVGVRQVRRVDHARHPGMRLGVGELEAADLEEPLAEARAASHLDRECRRTEVALHPGEALPQRVAEIGARSAVVFGARQRDVAGMRDDRHQAGSRPQRSRAMPKIESASADDHAMADTSGAPQSVPEKNVWKKIAAYATYLVRWVQRHSVFVTDFRTQLGTVTAMT